MEEEENDPDVVLPHMLFDQESHDLICPVCEHAVTGEVILQKRKRELEPVESGGWPHGIQASPHKENKWPGLSPRVTKVSFADVSDEDKGEAEMRSALEEQTNYELLCPDCESCITHEVILQKRKRATSDTLPRRKPWTQPPPHLHPGRRGGGGMGELNDSDEEDPPLKRHRRLDRAIADTDREGREIRRILKNQRIYDLSCPDCASRITYQVILKPKTNASRKPAGLLEKGGRRRRKFVTNYIDDNPWKTRYKREHGHSTPIAVAKKAKADKIEEAQSRAVTKYGPIEKRSLAEPLLTVQQEEDTGEEAIPPTTIEGRYRKLKSKFKDICGPCTITYFLLLLFLYFVWWLLRVI